MGKSDYIGIFIFIAVVAYLVIAIFLNIKESKEESKNKTAKVENPAQAPMQTQVPIQELKSDGNNHVIPENSPHSEAKVKAKMTTRRIWAAVLFILQFLATAGNGVGGGMELGYALLSTVLLYCLGIAATVLVFFPNDSNGRGSMFSKTAIAVFLMGLQIAFVVGINFGVSYAYGANLMNELFRTLGFYAPSIIGIILLIIEESRKKTR